MLATPLAAAMLVFYLLVGGVLTLTIGGFIDGNSASLDGFFVWQPWLFLFLCAALTMGTWTEEYRSGSAELLLTLPFSPATLVFSKFAAGMTILLVGLACTAPFPVTCALLGNPDWGPILTGYLGCLLAGGFFLAMGQCASVWTANQLVSFLLALFVGLAVILAGFRPMNLLLLKWGVPPQLMHFLSTSGLSGHFEEFTSGRVGWREAYFFAATTSAWLLLAVFRLRMRHGPRRRKNLLLPATAIALFALIPAADKLHGRIDCTADRLFTLDEGSREILASLENPAEILFVYSQNHPEISAVTRRHAARVRELLREFSADSNGTLTLREFHPDSPADQDKAAALGLKPQIGGLGDLWFLGAVVRPTGEGRGQTVVLPWLDASEGSSLEYELARAISAAQRTGKRRVGLFSTLPVLEKINMESRTLTPAWWSIRKLQEQFEVVELDGKTPPEASLDALILLHPKEMSQEFLDWTAAFLDAGGGVFAALDPLSRVEAQINGLTRLTRASELPEMLAERWGVDFEKGRVVADRALASPMTDSRRGIETIPTLVTVSKAQLSDDSPVTSHLSSLTFFCGGYFDVKESQDATATVLAHSTPDSQALLTYQAKRDAAAILTDFKPDNREYPLALQISEDSGGRAILVGDADWLHDSICVNLTTDAMGADREIPLNDNAAFLLNSVESLCDDVTLLRLRSRGAKPRTFTKIEELGRKVEKRIQELDAEAYQENADLRARGRALLHGRSQDDPEVQRQLDLLAEEDARQQQRLKERQREVLFQFRGEIDRLERGVALWNMLLTPGLLALAAILVAWRRRR